MKALVVYESLYGNTAAIGEAIASSLRTQGLDVVSDPVSTIVPSETAAADLLVVGGPTHMHGMSRPVTRKVGAEDEKNTFAEPTVAPGLREWLTDLPPGAGRFAAAFDTRIHKSPLLTGSAAKGIERRLTGQGFRMIVEPESFFVTGENRLEEGQTERATTWAGSLVQRATEKISR
ncbi:MAG: flavodoxin family protein [Actinomycetota bacterium]